MINDFRFGTTWLSDVGCRLTTVPPVEIATRNVSLIDIPGRDGAECIDNGFYNNVEFTREIGFVNKLGEIAPENKVINWLAYLQGGYYEFEDTQHPGEITYAVLTNFGQIQKQLQRIHKATLQFSRHPYWYSKNGLIKQKYTTDEMIGGTVEILNPYNLNTKPIFYFHMKGSINTKQKISFEIIVNDVKYSYVDVPYINVYSKIVLDCEKEQMYVTDNRDNIYKYVDISKVPQLLVGSNKISISSDDSENIDSISIIPRWRKL